MPQKSSLHYHDDGDIILIVQDTIFCLHKNYLSMASRVFRDLFSCASSSPSSSSSSSSSVDSLHELPRVNITDISSSSFENFLSFIYPQKFIPITWDNISDFCQIADKYEFPSVLEAAETFLEPNFHHDPLFSLLLADTYHFKSIYKESSKLVLNNFQFYRQNLNFLLLSYKTKSALFERYLDFTISITTIHSLKQHKDFLHHSLCRHDFHTLTNHNQEINNWYDDFFEKCNILKLNNNNNNLINSPSKLINLIFIYLMDFWNDYVNGSWSECDYRFFNDYLAKQFVNHFGEFEPLKSEESKRDAEHYMYIELKD